MNDSSPQRDEVERLAEEFLERRRRGERPTISEYARAHPALAEEIKELFPAIAFVENMADSGELRPPKPQPLPAHIADYRILREVGRGGMGVVYEAIQESLGRHVALKVLPHSALASPVHLERFRREARAAGQLHHTNIVPVFGVGEADGLHYYVMQFIQGQPLDTVLRAMQRQRGQAKTHAGADATTGGSIAAMPRPDSSASANLTSSTDAEYYRRVARIGVQVADALAYAHDQGVLHRDIKPANLILDVRDTVWITDFGLAKTQDDGGLTNTGDFVGTTRYMAPERFNGVGDPRSDVYGLGVTLYELLTLRPAFVETDRPRLIEQVLHAEPPPLRQLDRKIPRDLETIVLKAMAKEPRDRYPSSAAMAEDLRRFVADRPIVARRTPWPERLWRWCRRNPRLATAAGVAIAALLVISIGSPLMTLRLWEQRRQTQQELWTAQLARAEAARSSPEAGRRFSALRALDAARGLIPSLAPTDAQRLDLRNQYIASLSLADLGKDREWDGYPPGTAGVCFDHKLERYARSDSQGNISVRRFADDQELMSLPGEGQGAWTMQFSPDGKYLATGYQKRFERDALQFCIWDLQAKKAIVRSPNAIGCGEACFAPNGKMAAFMADGGELTLRRLDDEKADEELYQVNGLPKRVAFRPDGKRLAATLGKAVEVYDIKNWKATDKWSHPADVNGVAWRDDGGQLATASGSNIFLWEPGKKSPVGTMVGHEGQVREVTFSHRGDLLASKAYDGTVRLWDVATRKQLVRADCVYTGCARMYFSPDDSRLGFASDGSRLWLWRVARGAECQTFAVGAGTDFQSFDGRFSPDGRLLVVGGKDGFRIWDWQHTSASTFVAAPSCFSAMFCGNNKLYTTNEQGLLCWTQTGANGQWTSSPLGETMPMLSGALSTDNTTAVVSLGQGRGAIIDLDHPDRRVELKHSQMNSVAINHNGTLVATGPWYGDNVGVRVWDSTGKVIQRLPAEISASVTFAPMGKSLIVATEKEYRLFDCNDWKELWHIDKYSEIRPGESSFAADGSLLALRRSPTQMRLIDPMTGRVLADVQTPNFRTYSWHALSPDGQALAACCLNGPIYIWDLRLIRGQLAERGLDW